MSLIMPPASPTSVTTDGETLSGNGTTEDPLAVDPTVLTMRQISITLTDAQIKALPTTPIMIFPAVAGKIIMPIQAIAVVNTVAGGYTGVSGVGCALEVSTLLAGYNEVESFLLQGNSANEIILFVPFSKLWNTDTAPSSANPGSASAYVGQPLQLVCTHVGGTNFTGGHADNTIKLSVYYVVVTV